MKYKITEDCLSCGACVSECPLDAISEGDGIYVIDQDKCEGCAACVDACPADAIKES